MSRLRALSAALVAFFALQCAGGSRAPASAAPRRAVPRSPTAEGLAEPKTAPLRGSLAVIAGSPHVALGVPRDADPADDHYLDERAFVLSYNPDKRVANWVAWRLERSDLGRAKRRNDFRPDLLLPARFYRVNESDYRHSGYDRGHLCPSADRASSALENSRTFVFTNIQPQVHELNAGPWEKLERYSRERAERGDRLYIVAGGVFAVPHPTIGKGVAVPRASFKVIVFQQPGQSLADMTERTEVLAALMPNEPGVGERPWTEYLTSVDAIEEASGYDLLTALPESVQRVVEARRTSL